MRKRVRFKTNNFEFKDNGKVIFSSEFIHGKVTYNDLGDGSTSLPTPLYGIIKIIEINY